MRPGQARTTLTGNHMSPSGARTRDGLMEGAEVPPGIPKLPAVTQEFHSRNKLKLKQPIDGVVRGTRGGQAPVAHSRRLEASKIRPPLRPPPAWLQVTLDGVGAGCWSWGSRSTASSIMRVGKPFQMVTPIELNVNKPTRCMSKRDEPRPICCRDTFLGLDHEL